MHPQWLAEPLPAIALVCAVLGYSTLLVYHVTSGFAIVTDIQNKQESYRDAGHDDGGDLVSEVYPDNLGQLLLSSARLVGGAIEERENAAEYLLDPTVLGAARAGRAGRGESLAGRSGWCSRCWWRCRCRQPSTASIARSWTADSDAARPVIVRVDRAGRRRRSAGRLAGLGRPPRSGPADGLPLRRRPNRGTGPADPRRGAAGGAARGSAGRFLRKASRTVSATSITWRRCGCSRLLAAATRTCSSTQCSSR